MDSFESVRSEYMKRNDLSGVSTQDTRLINAICNLRKHYAEELKKRHTTILIDQNEIMYAPVIKQPPAKKEEKKTAAKSKTEEVYCQATKMDGNKCTAKAKPGCVFCGRHLPKQK